MKRKTILYLLPAVIVILLIFLWKVVVPKQNGLTDDNVEAYIKVKKLTNKVISVSLGYDAVTAINTKNGIAVIDAGISNSLTQKHRNIIEKEFKRNDFAYLIDTHSHYDHTGGNQVFTDAVIIGHENCINEMTEYWKDKEKIESGLQEIINNYDNQLKNFDPTWQDSLEIKLQKVRYQHAYNDLLNDRIVTLPQKTFKDTMNLYLGDITLNLIYFGKAHSESDIIIHCPEEKLLMVGDLFSRGGIPSIRNVDKFDIKRRMKVIKWLEARMNEINVVINGHGQIMNRYDLKEFIRISKERE